MLSLSHDDIVIPLWARLWRRQPDLLVGRLFVDDVCADFGTEGKGQDTSLFLGRGLMLVT
jgi:hypothetical protein